MTGAEGLWYRKHSPKTLDDFQANTKVAATLKKLALKDDLPHILLYGPTGVGKKTLIEALLLHIYGEGVKKVRAVTGVRTFQVSGRNVEVNLSHIVSNYHMDLTPSSVGNKDRHIVQQMIKELCSQRPPHLNISFFSLILNDIHLLTPLAQHALRRTMETHSRSCRMIMHCTNLSKVITPIRSRCLCIRVPDPTEEEIQEVLQTIAAAESIELPDFFSRSIAADCRGNLRRAILALEVIAKEMVSDLRLQTALATRGRLYELFVNCVPPNDIIKNLTFELLPMLSKDDSIEVCKHAAIFEDKMNRGGNPIMHLEAFVLRVMAIHKKSLGS